MANIKVYRVLYRMQDSTYLLKVKFKIVSMIYIFIYLNHTLNGCL